ncbi:Uncharacterized protein OBRU01_19641 [Operophtera brumata]|uniref:Uncharacterized protein n=1 Tax=Operophtera brumata TaxID=104452 RepID=A0A0L7KWN7_OPEBR|nr:Uncharacterized protein OBRU01_19641 [Operophtera brumata]
MGTELPNTQESSGETDSNSEDSNSECSGSEQSTTRKPHFSVTSSDTGLKLKIAAIPRKVTTKKSAKPTVKNKESKSLKALKERAAVKKPQVSSSSSSESCSKCSSDSSSDDDLPLKTVSKSLPQKCSPQKTKPGKNTTLKSESDDDQKCNEELKETVSRSKDKPCASRTISTVVKKPKAEETAETTVKRGRGRPRTKVSAFLLTHNFNML